jgi:hypothetical protein
LADVSQTPWGLVGVEITVQRLQDHPEQVELQARFAFDQPPQEPLQVTIQWADHTLSSLLDEHGFTRFTGIELDHLFETRTGLARADLNVVLRSAA